MRWWPLTRQQSTLAVALACLLLAACPQTEATYSGRSGKLTASPEVLTIAYTGGLRGFQRPCG